CRECQRPGRSVPADPSNPLNRGLPEKKEEECPYDSAGDVLDFRKEASPVNHLPGGALQDLKQWDQPAGNSIVNVLPRPGPSLETRRSPPMRRASPRAIKSPNPEPFAWSCSPERARKNF